MVFSSVTFLFAFLPVVLAGYYLLPKSWRMPFLLLASLVFYAWGEPVYVFLMIGSILVNWGIGLLIGRMPAHKKAFLTVSTVLNLAMLAVFKYAGFLLHTLSALIPALGAVELSIRLPIGISFFTFQIMSYVIDVYRGNAAPQKDPILFGAYVSMFPQLIAGPIVRYVDIEKQLYAHTFCAEQFCSGIRLFLIGLGKKLLLANAAGVLWTQMSGDAASGTLGAWVGLLAYTFQIYFDFSGYSDMARGLGCMLGFSFVENFRYPYTATSITDYWRRWHISLSAWFLEYLYIPLGGNRRGLKRQIFNILVVWLLTGLWHGASWNFVLWGLFFALLLILEKAGLLKLLSRLPKWIGWLYTMAMVMLSWGIFCISDLAAPGAFFARLFLGGAGLIGAEALAYTIGYLPWLLLCAVASTPLLHRLGERFQAHRGFRTVRAVALILLFLLSVGALAAGSYNPFIYFRF